MIIIPGQEPSKYVKTSAGILIPENYTDKKHPTAFDFFAGCGGFSCGIVQGGFDVIGAMEFDPSASWTYMHNLCDHPVQIFYTSDFYRNKLEKFFQKQFETHMKNQAGKKVAEPFGLSGQGWISKVTDDQGNPYPKGKNFFFGDIRESSGEKICRSLGIMPGDLDLIVGGPPCQGYSTAGKRNVADPRNNLVFEYARLLCELQPKAFVMENVPGIKTMVTPAGVPVIHQFMAILESGDYMSYEGAMQALGIREKEIGYKPAYVVKTAGNKPKKGKNKKKANRLVIPRTRQSELF